MANVLSFEKRLSVLASLVEGNSERATARMTGVHPDTIGRFVLRLGEGANWLHNSLVRDLNCSLVEMDEQWSFVKKKQSRVTSEDGSDVGSVWTWIAVHPESQLTISFHIGKRTAEDAKIAVSDLRSRLSVKPSLISSDGLAAYMTPILESFGPDVNYAQIIKDFSGKYPGPDYRYEPKRDPRVTKKAVLGNPDLTKANTGHVEHNNLVSRHFNGRMRRLCLAFSKKLENHRAAAILGFVHRNFCHIPRNLRTTPAVAAGVTDHVWDLAEFLSVILAKEPCEAPSIEPLIEKAQSASIRKLPNGRGILRLVSPKFHSDQDREGEPALLSPPSTGKASVLVGKNQPEKTKSRFRVEPLKKPEEKPKMRFRVAVDCYPESSDSNQESEKARLLHHNL